MTYGFIETKSGEVFWWEYTSDQEMYPDWKLYIRCEFIQRGRPLYFYEKDETTIIPASEVRNIWMEEL